MGGHPRRWLAKIRPENGEMGDVYDGQYLPKVHPDKTRDAIWKQTMEAAVIEHADVRMMMDRLSWQTSGT